MGIFDKLGDSIGNVITGGVGSFISSAFQANRQGDIADHAMHMSAAEAQRNRDFQEQMRGTQYQTAIKDMKAAGLNPMLAYSQGGAGTPAGATGSGFSGQISAPDVAANMQSAAQVELMKAQAKKLESETDLNRSLMKTPGAERNAAGDLPTTSFPAAEVEARGRFLHNQARHEISRTELTDSQRELVRQEVKNAIEEERRIRANTRDTTANAILRELAEAEAKNLSEHHKAYQTYGQDVRPFIQDAGRLIHSAEEAAEAFRAFRKPPTRSRR